MFSTFLQVSFHYIKNKVKDDTEKFIYVNMGYDGTIIIDERSIMINRDAFRFKVLDVYIKVSLYVCLFFTALFAILGAWTAASFQAACAMGMYFAFRVLKNEAYDMAKVLSLLCSYLAVFVQGFVFFDAIVGFHFQYLALMVVIFMISDMSKKADVGFALGAAVLFASSYVFIENFALNTIGDIIPLSTQQYFSGLSAVVTFGALFVILYVYSKAFHQTQTELEYLANFDPLTKLHNKRSLGNLSTDWLKDLDHVRYLHVAMVDLDDFKLINDQYGHIAGDHILMQVATKLQRHFGVDGIVARYGGEEFTLVFHAANMQLAYDRLAILRQDIEATTFSLAGHTIRMTVSVGVAKYSPTSNSLDLLLSRADAALYRAKAKGKNRIEIHEKD